MENQIITSKQYTIDWRDAVKSFLLAVLTPVLLIVQQTLESGNLVFDWTLLLKVAVAAAVGYLTKNFFTGSEVKVKVSAETVEHLDAQKP